ncbi:hypothetical protein DFJ58DRAFT_732128 [Suillus subalutaceus]|uniref:uncharacterized protein n=1 Tax=Suillus subalutaceus TaxID=48586 RepID=UPI001B86C021|nr:uncharacterized protein DFJ58DRAFT_732128 [Suillus subalutaceus]KAG1842269.1 hypothetical protein DFJ58DRAFT_732128 [Suillus subalutaceus]
MPSFIPGHFGEYPPPSAEGPSHPERPQYLGQTNVISEILQVASILATLYFVIALLFRFATDSVPDPLTKDTLQALGEEQSHPEQPQGPGETRITGVQQVVITAIHATDLALGLRRIPAGFHVVVKADGTERQTSNRPVHVDQAVVEWNEPILLPCEPSSEVRVSVYASFELGPMLCHGEALRTLETSVGELLDCSEKSHPIIFQPKQGEVVSPCTSLFVTVEQQLSDQNKITVLCPLTTLTSPDMDATQNSRDLDQSIEHFEHASDLCPMDHPYRPAALFNLATAKFVSCQANGTYLDLDIPISLFLGALDLRPTDHLDRTVTQLHLAIALLSRFAKMGFQMDADWAEQLLSEVVNVCHADSHIHRAALIAIETASLGSSGSIDVNDLRQERPGASMLLLSLNQLACLAECCLYADELHVLDEVISLHNDALEYYNTGHGKGQLLGNLAVMLQTRFERRGNEEDLDQAIALQRDGLALCPVGHTDHLKLLNNLANGLSFCFEHRGNDEDLDQAIVLHAEALASFLVSSYLRVLYVDQNTMTITIVFFKTKVPAPQVHSQRIFYFSVDNVVEALALCPVGHTDRFKSLNNLGIQLSSRFEHRGNGEDLDQTISLCREALTLHPVGHTDRSKSLNNLATQLSIRFHHGGNDEDLDQAIAFQTEVLALCPIGHIDQSGLLNNLANQLSFHFDH